ncbi:S8 family peptidase [Spongiactinospora sp. 9N601]|uniref:S8 family peptidase n=1 Tax=Spongiactinospora sp. 9N601 TaxID=3375149 RepID=UPI0037A1119D
MKRRALMTAIALVAAVTTGAGAPASATGPSPGSPGVAPDRQAGHGAKSVTLITGDRVKLSSSGYSVHPGKGRDVRFATIQKKDHLMVLPSDAAPLVARGLVDERLFDVTQLIAWDYDDAHRADVPVIARTSGAAAATFRLPGAPAPAWRSGRLGLAAVKVPKSDAAAAWRALTGDAGARTLAAGVKRLWLDGRRTATLDQSAPQIGAPEAWKQGFTGKGVTVAVLDSGYDTAHPDLKGVVAHAKSFIQNDPDINDGVGHGTHVASTIAGSGAASGGRYRGIAPDAKLAIGKVLSRRGGDESTILAGMEWAAAEIRAQVVSMSLGGRDTQALDPLEEAVNTLSESTGALFVIAAGNSGPTASSVVSPGSADAALSVGAVDKQDALALFSSRGPRIGDRAVKPDITAPGVGITAARARYGGYSTQTGTSMATPHVAGAAAILAQRNPGWRADRLKSALISSAAPQPDAGPYAQGAGRVDVRKAIAQTVVAVPGNVSAALRWPHEKGQQATRTIAYANTGDAPVTLDLAIAAQGGGELPAGLFSLSADRLMVPAGGHASVTVTMAADGVAPGAYAGVVTATAGGTVVRTLTGAYVEPEAYDLAISAKGGAGLSGFAVAFDLARNEFEYVDIQDGKGTLRLPAVGWYVQAVFDAEKKRTVAHVPPFRLSERTKQLTIDLDAGRQVRHSVDDPAARQAALDVSATQQQGQIRARFSTIASDDQIFVVPSEVPGLTYQAHSVLTKGDASPSPYRYDLLHTAENGLPADPTHQARTADLAKTTVTYRGAGVAAYGYVYSGPANMWLLGAPTRVPSTQIRYRPRVDGLAWANQVASYDDSGEHWLVDLASELPPGAGTEVWNTAVYGAAQTPSTARYSNTVVVDGAVFSDSGPARFGYESNADVAIALARDGVELARVTCMPPDSVSCTLGAEVPGAESTYTLTMSGRRQVPYSALATAVDATWTFRSGTVDAKPLPLITVRPAAQGLDALNRAERASLTRIPLMFERHASPALGRSRPKVEVSFNDGATWRRVPVSHTRGQWTAMVRNPAAGDFASLRVSAESGDSTFTQTIIRAYGLTS